MDRSDLRRYHSNAVFHRIRVEPQISQREIIEKTGFDKSTVSSIVNGFAARGLIKRQSRTNVNQRGRPSEGLLIAPDCGLLVGVEVEVSSVAYVVCGLDGAPIAHEIRPFSGRLAGFEAYLADGVRDIIAATNSSAPTLGVGVSLPGLVRSDGSLVHTPALGWRDVDMQPLLSGICPAPVFIGNDGKAAAMAERMFGACVDVEDFVYLFSGSGVGGGLFLNEAVYTGADGLAGELGHIKIVPQGRICGCGAAGCLSAYLSRPALLDEIHRLGGPALEGIDELVNHAEAGDELVLNVLDHAGEVLGTAVSTLVNIFNPPVVMLGGDLARLEAFLTIPLDRSLRRLAHPAMLSRCSIKFVEQGRRAIPVGAVALALNGITSLDDANVLH